MKKPSLNDVVIYILENTTGITTMRLHKYAYLVQTWFVKETGEPLFDEIFEAWENGPVAPSLLPMTSDHYQMEAKNFGEGDSDNLDEQARLVIDGVVDTFREMPGWQFLPSIKDDRAYLLARPKPIPKPVAKEENPEITIDMMLKAYAPSTPTQLSLEELTGSLDRYDLKEPEYYRGELSSASISLQFDGDYVQFEDVKALLTKLLIRLSK